jgi:amino acid adenylation domain-containing protein
MNHPTAPIMSNVPESAQAARVRQWNATARPYPRQAGLAELFGRWTREAPDACAVIDGERQLSYWELDQRANVVAHALVDHGVEVGQRVGVLGRRRAEAIVAIVGITKAGAAYVPLDTEYPASRLEAMSEDAGLRVVIAAPGEITATPENVPQVLRPDNRLIAHPPSTARAATGEDLAYIMFTSGSTGRPKAVGIRQRGITRLVIGTDYVTLAPGDRVLHASSLSFDASTFEIWGALLNGACLVVANSKILLSPTDLRHFFRTHAITVALITTAVFHHLAHQQPDVFDSVRDVLVGGEALNLECVRRVLARRRPPQRLVNGYGPTENTTLTTTYPVHSLSADATAIAIGKPIANTTCYVLRDDGSLADIGEKGELVTGGDGVAVGYLNDPALNAERFIPDPFSDDASARLYRTGDLASWREDGTIEYHGRRDTQFKIHGYRIEAAEIETALRGLPCIADAIVTRSEANPTGEARTIAYFISAGDQAPSATELREQLGRILPSYMIPTIFMPLEQLPLSPNGKIDRAALPAPPDPAPLNPEVSSAPSESQDKTIEDQVRDIWSEVLRSRGIERTIEPEDTLFDIGGTSFDVPNIHARVTALFDNPDLTPLDLFTYPTLRSYADYLASLLDAKAH